jgi:EPS-associated MarR family transcriptional regulator
MSVQSLNALAFHHTMPTEPGEHPADLELLGLLEQHPEYSQRQLSAAMGVSLGKTHYLLKALLAKGWVKAQNFQRSDHKLGYLYVLTPQGVRRRLQLTQSFLTRKEQEYETLKKQIDLLREQLASQTKALP